MLDRLREAGARQVVYDVQFTEPSDRPDDDLALYDAVARTGHVILATGESDGHGAHARARRRGAARARGRRGGRLEHVPARRRRRDPPRTRASTPGWRRSPPSPRAARSADARRREALIDFRGPPGTIPTYSFVDVLRGRVGADELRGKTVVVGASAPVLQDVHPTSAPGEKLMSGPELQANAIWTAVHGNPLRRAARLGRRAAGARARRPGHARGARARPGPRRRGRAARSPPLYAGAAQLAFAHGSVLPVAVPLTALVAALAVCVPAGAAAEIAARTRTARYNAELEAAVHARTAELAETQLEVVVRLAQAAELRDDDTGDHIERMSGLCREVALELGLSAAEADLIRHASVLHDIGKIGVPDGILLKPGRLTDDEMTIMRRHVLDGALLLTGSDSELLQAAEVIVRTHHERWDGTGYPLGPGR